MRLVSLLITALIFLECDCQDFWSDVGWTSGNLLRHCFKFASNQTETSMAVVDCLQRRSLFLLQKTMDQDVISLGRIKLVKFGNSTISKRTPRVYKMDNLTFDIWKNEMLNTFTNVFMTHNIKINMEDNDNKNITEEGRGRRKHLDFYVFALVALGTVMVPMGFKFLAVLGGKAILLAKMALLLASIQGLKKMATSDFHYGLYQAPPAAVYYDRKSQEDHYPYYPEDYYQSYPSAAAYPYVKRVAV